MATIQIAKEAHSERCLRWPSTLFRPPVSEAKLTAAVEQGDSDQVLAQINVCCPPRPATITTETLLDYLEGYHTEDTLLASIRLENLA